MAFMTVFGFIRRYAMRIFLMASAVWMLAACGAYIPHSVSMPMIDHKGALNADAAFTSGSGYFAGQASAAYGFTDHLAAQVYVSNIPTTHLQGMVGSYWPLGSHFHVDAYGGYAHQWVDERYDDAADGSFMNFNGSHNIIFLQGDIGTTGRSKDWSDGLYFTGGLTMKVGCLLSDVTLATPRYDAYGNHVGTSYDQLNSSCMLFEPSIQLGVGWGWISFNTRIGISFPSAMRGDSGLTLFPYTFGLGLSIRPF